MTSQQQSAAREIVWSRHYAFACEFEFVRLRARSMRECHPISLHKHSRHLVEVCPPFQIASVQSCREDSLVGEYQPFPGATLCPSFYACGIPQLLQDL